MRIGIFFGSSTGNAQTVAEKIAASLSDHEVQIKNASEFSANILNDYDFFILGSSTWGFGELQDDWNETIDELDKMDFEGKKIALFGTGDAAGWGDTFVDAMGLIYEKLGANSKNLIGQTDPAPYSFNTSKALIADKFVGLAIDENNESNLTDERIESWIQKVKTELAL